MSPELTVVLPVHDEEESVDAVVEDWDAVLRGLGVRAVIRVYDDGSRDGTPARLRALAGRIPNLQVIRHDNRGHGPTILRGYREADTPWVFQADGDGEIAAKHFATLWERRHDGDLLLGARQGRDAPAFRRGVTAAAVALVRAGFGGQVSDPNTPFRLMRRETLEGLLARIPEDAFAPNVLIAGLAARSGLRIVERPVPFEGRRAGRAIPSSRLARGAVRAGAQTVATALRRRR